MIKEDKLRDDINNSSLSYGDKLTILNILKGNNIIKEVSMWGVAFHRKDNEFKVVDYIGNFHGGGDWILIKDNVTAAGAFDLMYNLNEVLNNNGKTI